MSINTANTQDLLELVIVNLSEFADLEYLAELQKLVKDSEYDQFSPILAKLKKYYEKNKIFPSRKYWQKKWKAELSDEPWLLEYASELVAKLRTEIVYKKVSDLMSKEPDGDLISQIQKCLYNYTPTKQNKAFNEEELADSLRKVLKKKKERGAGLLTYTSLDKYTYGCPFGATTVIGAKPKSGKSLESHTKLPTPNGLIEIGYIKVGDYVYGMDGKPTKVTDVFPQGEKDLYKIVFWDGTYELCCKEHLWLVKVDNKSQWIVQDTQSLIDNLDIHTYKIPHLSSDYTQIRDNKILSITYWGKSDATCIMVDNESHTYITENLNVTHNSNLAMGLAWGAVTKQDLKGIYISLEMSADVIYQRLFSRYMYDRGVFIDNADIIKGKLSPEDEKIYLDNLDAFEKEVKSKLCVVTQENLPELNKMELEAFLLRKDAEMDGLDFLIVDQVSLLKYFSGITGATSSSNAKTFDIINAYVRYFTVASYTLFKKKVAVILLSQIKREEYSTIDKRKPLGLEIFAESSEIERSCNVAVAIRLDDQLKNSNLFELVLLLNRDGDNNTEYVPNVFIPKHCYVGSLGDDVQQQDISTTDTSSLFSFMESSGEDEELEELFK